MFTIKLTPLFLFSIIIFTLIIAVMFGNKLSLAEPFENSPEGERSESNLSPSVDSVPSPTTAFATPSISTTGETLIVKLSEDLGIYRLEKGTIVQKKINLLNTPGTVSVPGTLSSIGSESVPGTEINTPSASRNGYTSVNGIEVTYHPPT